MPRAPGTGILMGMQSLGGTDVIFKRKYRWTFSIASPCGPGISEQIVKLASRPNLTIEEQEINFLHGKMWLPGKGTWETITVTFYDVASQGQAGSLSTIGLYSWLATVYNFTDPDGLHQSSVRGSGDGSGGYSGEVELKLYDGCGKDLETWTLGNCWPQAINFGELDYASSEEVTIEVTLRYAEVTFVNECGAEVTVCCEGCDS